MIKRVVIKTCRLLNFLNLNVLGKKILRKSNISIRISAAITLYVSKGEIPRGITMKGRIKNRKINISVTTFSV